MADMTGIWLGTYWQWGQPTRFEASLVQGGNTLEGRILDDGYLGEACLSGQLDGVQVGFTKRYFTTSPSPICYTGILSEDGTYVRGHWQIGPFDSGTWEAYRASDLMVARFNDAAATSSSNGEYSAA